MQSKSLFRSKTFWVNALTLVAGVTGYVAGHEVLQDYTSVLPLLVAVQGGVNIVLRLLTTQPIK